MQETFSRTQLKRKTKEQLIDLLFLQSKSIIEITNIVNEQNEMISKMQKFSIDIENDAKENFKQQMHLNRVNNSIDISERRLYLAKNIITPLQTGEYTYRDLIDDDETVQLANNIIKNEFNKILRQQQTESKAVIKTN